MLHHATTRERQLKLDPDRLMTILRDTICASVRADAPDLSARQLAILLVVVLEDELHTVRGLAQRLLISKPATSRSLDRLCTLGLADRAPDLRDGRSVLVEPTELGMEYVADLRSWLVVASRPGGGRRFGLPAPRRRSDRLMLAAE
jgi:DNA-binding MarR family transcriptional regulator